MDNPLAFEQLQADLGVGVPVPVGWRPLADCRLAIIVGVTGVGKSTVLARLADAGLDFTLLPDRRVLTDRLIISAMQAQDGEPAGPVRDRSLRFDYTRRYRARYAGGMAHALSQVAAAPALAQRLLLFDGLRGADEVRHAAAALPHAYFIVLEAPDIVRVQRLLGRQDAFDAVCLSPSEDIVSSGLTSLADLGVPDAAALFSAGEAAALLTWVRRGEVSADDLRAKLRIVVEERRNYDPAAARAVLQEDAPGRTLCLDTVALDAAQIAQAIAAWLPF